VSKYNIYDATPFKRDPLKELADACARHGIRFGFYYSQAQDWHEPNGAGNTWDFPPDNQKDFDQYLRGKAEPQVKELLTGYGPVCLIWFDTPRMMDTGDRAKRFIDIAHALQPWTLIDGRLGGKRDYRPMADNTKQDKKGGPAFVQAVAWRCTTKPGKLYIHLFQWPSGSFELDKMKGTASKAYMLADAKHAGLKMKQSGDKLTVSLPTKPTSP